MIALSRLRVSPLVIVLAAILLVLIVPPALFLLNVSLHETRPDGSFGAFTLRFYRGLFAERLFLSSAGNTLIYAFGSSVIGIVIGTVQALIVERTNTPVASSRFSARSSRSACRTFSMWWRGSCCSVAPARSTTPYII